jgi:hypothetical protein
VAARTHTLCTESASDTSGRRRKARGEKLATRNTSCCPYAFASKPAACWPHWFWPHDAMIAHRNLSPARPRLPIAFPPSKILAPLKWFSR